jgi:hypothetical protein
MAVDDSYTKSLLHFDGADGSTTFTDESDKTWTRYGDAKISIIQYKFENSSGLFDGNGDYISTPNHTDLNFGNDDFTIDTWFRFSVTPNLSNTGACQRIASKGSINAENGSWCFGTYSDKINFAYRIGNNIIDRFSSAVSIGAFSWHHIALVRASGVIYFYLDGISKGSAVCNETLTTTATTTIATRAGTSLEFFPGNIDEFRLSKGIARWTSDFSSDLPKFQYPVPNCYLQPRRHRLLMGGISTQNYF